MTPRQPDCPALSSSYVSLVWWSRCQPRACVQQRPWCHARGRLTFVRRGTSAWQADDCHLPSHCVALPSVSRCVTYHLSSSPGVPGVCTRPRPPVALIAIPQADACARRVSRRRHLGMRVADGLPWHHACRLPLLFVSMRCGAACVACRHPSVAHALALLASVLVAWCHCQQTASRASGAAACGVVSRRCGPSRSL